MLLPLYHFHFEENCLVQSVCVATAIHVQTLFVQRLMEGPLCRRSQALNVCGCALRMHLRRQRKEHSKPLRSFVILPLPPFRGEGQNGKACKVAFFIQRTRFVWSIDNDSYPTGRLSPVHSDPPILQGDQWNFGGSNALRGA